LSGILFIDFFLTTHMKRLCVAIFGVLFLFGTSFALPHFAEAKGGGSVHVNGYFKSNGTYVAPYMRSAPDSSPYNNYSYPGNTNPYTGKTATGDPATYIKNLYNHSGTSNSYTYPLTYPSTTITTSSPQVSVPANAHASPYSFDNGWLCDSGYKQTGNQCVKIIAPPNAHVSPYSFDNGWLCDSGYKQVGNQCEQIIAPAHAHVSPYSYDTGWLCDTGYRQMANECQRIIVPTNAHPSDYSSQGWFCNLGYGQSGSSCIPN
jgi:hypothetical protein